MMTLPTDALAIILGLLFLLAGILAHRASKSKESKFSLEDLFLDPLTGKASLSKLGQFTALSVSTWGFAYITLSQHMTEWYMGIYCASWAGANLASKWIDQKESK